MIRLMLISIYAIYFIRRDKGYNPMMTYFLCCFLAVLPDQMVRNFRLQLGLMTVGVALLNAELRARESLGRVRPGPLLALKGRRPIEKF